MALPAEPGDAPLAAPARERRWRETGPTTAQPDMPRLTSLHLKMIFATYESDVHPRCRLEPENVVGTD